jgi:hypothetical protein
MCTYLRNAGLLALLVLSPAGCRHYGPRSIVADRIPYNEAVAISWKEQTLLNVVKLRYMDTPFFLEVPQITSGYTLQAAATANGGIFPPVNPRRLPYTTTRPHAELPRGVPGPADYLLPAPNRFSVHPQHHDAD